MFAEQRDHELPPYDGSEPLHTYVARIALTVEVGGNEELRLIAKGPAAKALPDVAFAMRARQRRIVGYVIIDGDLPAPHPDWPDAPVTYVRNSDSCASLTNAQQARLRGWDVQR